MHQKISKNRIEPNRIESNLLLQYIFNIDKLYYCAIKAQNKQIIIIVYYQFTQQIDIALFAVS